MEVKKFLLTPVLPEFSSATLSSKQSRPKNLFGHGARGKSVKEKVDLKIDF